jgi:hypothetical protein
MVNMKGRKLFGTGAAILMILIAFTPVINGMQSNLEKENNNVSSSTAEIDIQVTLDTCQFIGYELDKDGEVTTAVYEVISTVSHRGIFSEDKTINCELKSVNYPKIFDSFSVLFKKDTYEESIEKTRTVRMIASPDPDSDVERKFAGKTVRLETDYGDDIDNSNNVGRIFSQYWRDDYDYEPSLTHLSLTLPHDGWDTGNDEIYDIQGTTILIPKFSDTFKGFGWPNPFKSEKMGWIGEFTKQTLDFLANLSVLAGELVHIGVDVTLLALELQAFLTQLSSMMALMSSGVFLPAQLNQLLNLLTLLGSIIATINDLISTIQGLFDPELWEPISASFSVYSDFMTSQPWYDQISIAGSVKNCKSGEKVKVSCRDVKDKEVEGGVGTRDFGPFLVDSSFDSGKKDHLLFRNCQTIVEGESNTVKTPRVLSYVAPSGSLHSSIGLKAKAKDVHKQPCLLNFLSRFPLLMKLLQIMEINLAPGLT